MALYDTTSAAHGRRSVSSAPGLFGRLRTAFLAWNEARTTRSALNALSDHELDDVGLTRADIDRIARNEYLR